MFRFHPLWGLFYETRRFQVNKYPPRAFYRNYYDAPLLYRYSDVNRYWDAKVKNLSEDGMFFVTCQSLVPDAEIYIKIVDAVPEIFRYRRPLPSRAKVRWCREIDPEGVLGYGIGIQYMTNSHVKFSQQSCTCDLCGCTVHSGEIYRSRENIYSCSECFDRLSKLPEGKIRECVDGFLCGNVL
jgi:hypothetical protein